MNMLREFFKLESAAGLTLMLTSLLALIVVNSPFDSYYDILLHAPINIQISELHLHKSLLHWINDGLMVIFFLLIGCEVKREILDGELSSREQIMLPAIAATGGLIAPALIYSYFNWGDAILMRGWAIPAATDIAFALGVLLVLGKRVPESLKICLVALAIFDDLAAIVIIALFYTSDLSAIALMLSALTIAILIIFNLMGITRLTPYIIVGIFLWIFVLKSGVHATLAGVILALCIPYKRINHSGHSPLKTLEHNLHPWVAFGILPLFAFANAGVYFSVFTPSNLDNTITLGIAIGLLLGKPIGVMSVTYIAYKLRLCVLPKGITWMEFFGMSILTGIGFTMSLFIGTLAFTNSDQVDFVRAGVLIGSVAAGLIGYLILHYLGNKRLAAEQTS